MSDIPGTDGFGELTLTSFKDETGEFLWIDRADRRIRVSKGLLEIWDRAGAPEGVTWEHPLFTVRASNGTVTYQIGEALGEHDFAAEMVTGLDDPVIPGDDLLGVLHQVVHAFAAGGERPGDLGNGDRGRAFGEHLRGG